MNPSCFEAPPEMLIDARVTVGVVAGGLVVLNVRSALGLTSHPLSDANVGALMSGLTIARQAAREMRGGSNGK